MRKLAAVALLAAGVLALGARPAAAQDAQNTIRYSLGYLGPTSSYKADYPGGGQQRTVFQNALGVGLGYERRVSPLLGVEAKVQLFKPGVKVLIPGASGEKNVRFLPLTIGALFHFDTSTYKFYAGPELAYVNWGSIAAPVAPGFDGDLEFKSQLTWGLKVGADVPFNNGWSFAASIEYIDAKAEVDRADGASLNPKPLIVTLGAAYKF